MSGFMGYCPEAVRSLRIAMQAAAAELRELTCSDPDAAVAVRSVRSAHAVVDGWVPLLAQLERCGVMDGYVPAVIDASDLRLASLFALQNGGWRMMTDPVASLHRPMTADDARALGDLLASGDIRALLDSDAELSWLSGQLQTVAHDDLLLAALEERLPRSSTRWAGMCDELTVIRLAATDGNTSVVDDVFTGIGAVLRASSDAGRLFPEMEPYSAALLLTSLGWQGAPLGSAAASILQRWWDGPTSGEWIDDAPWGEQTADLLFRHVASDRAAATEFLLHASAYPPMIFTSAADRSTVDALLAAGLDSSQVAADVAGRIIVPIVEWVTDRADSLPTVVPEISIEALAVTMISPWLMHFGALANEWGWEPDEADARLRTVIEDGAANARLVAGLERWAGELASLPLFVDGVVNDEALDDLAETFWRLTNAFEHEEIADGDAARFFVDLAVMVADELIGHLPGKLPQAGADVMMPRVVDGLEALGILPPDGETVREREHDVMETRMVGAATVLVAALTIQLTARGALPEGTVSRLDVAGIARDHSAVAARDRLLAFIEGVDADAATRRHLRTGLNAILNVPYALDLDEEG